MVSIAITLDENEATDLVCILAVVSETFKQTDLKQSANSILDKLQQPVKEIFGNR